MSKLAQTQAAFQAYLLGNAPDASFLTLIVDDEQVGAQKRIGIYHDAYRLRLIEALATAYPNTKKLLGDDFFDDTTRAFIEASPSTYRNLRWYGSNFAQHLFNTLPQHAIAGELASFEWALALAFDAQDTTSIDRSSLATIAPEAWERLYFQFHLSLQRIGFTVNTVATWQALEADQAPPELVVQDSEWLIWREDHRPHYRSLGVLECLALDLALQGASFGHICEQLAEAVTEHQITDADPVEQAAQALLTWLNEGLITGFKQAA